MGTIETLTEIAALVRTLPGCQPKVELGCKAPALALLAAVPGARTRTSLYADPPRAIDVAELRIDGVEFAAQAGRDATDDERVRIAAEAREIAPALRAVSG